MEPRAGWYQHADHPGLERYWDGRGWTEHLRPIVAPVTGAQVGPAVRGVVPQSSFGQEYRRSIATTMVWTGVAVFVLLLTGNALGASSLSFFEIVANAVLDGLVFGALMNVLVAAVHSRRSEVRARDAGPGRQVSSGSTGGRRLTLADRTALRLATPGIGVEAGWQPDPLDDSQLRWWDGNAWTGQTTTKP